MKVSACIIAYNESDKLQACIRQIPLWVTEILVLVSVKPWKGMRADEDGRTLKTLQGIKDSRVSWITMNWRREHDQRNFGLARLWEYDWVMVLDADEYYTMNDWKRIRHEMVYASYDAHVLSACWMHEYWKTPDYRLSPLRAHKPTIAVQPQKTVFWENREPVETSRVSVDVTMHHFSWVRTDEEVWQKVHNWSHADDFEIKSWYNKHWKDWQMGAPNPHPYNTEYKTVIEDPVPQEILLYFK